MKKRQNVVFGAIYMTLIFIFAFFLSSVKNHYYVLGRNYIGADNIVIKEFVFKYFIEFWNDYHINLLWSIVPVAIINYLFVNTIVCFKTEGKKILDFVSMSIGITLFFTWGIFYLGLEEILFQMFCFTFFMILITLLEYVLKMCLQDKLGIVFPFAVGITVNMYYGICVLSTPYSHINVIPLFIFVNIMYIIRLISAILTKKQKWYKELKMLLEVIIVLFVAIILGFAGRDYFIHSAFQRDWRQLYYVVVYASFFLAYSMHFLPTICYCADKETYNAESLKKISLYIHSILLILIPVLCIFAVHGVILIISNGIVLLGSFFYSLYGLPKAEHGKQDILISVEAVAILLVVITYLYMALDPVFYVDPSKGISPIWPVWKTVAVIFPISIAILPLIFKAPEKKWRESVLDIVKGIKDSSDEYRYQLVIVSISTIILAVFAVYYQIKKYAYEEKDVFRMELIEPQLEGFGGINIFSWCMIPISLNIIVCIISIIFVFLRREIRGENDVSQN